jgi:hypothetical protein
MNKRLLQACLLLFLAFGTKYIIASALRQPPVFPRQWVITATGVAQSVTVEATDPTKPAQGPTRAIVFFHDGAAGDPDIWIGHAGATAAAPTNGGTILTLKQGDKGVSYDLEETTLSVISSGGNTSLRIQATY